MRLAGETLITIVGLWLGPPLIECGLATHYTDVITRSEEPYHAAADRVAVDTSLWDELAGKWLFVYCPETNMASVVQVNDTGRLHDAGWHVYTTEAEDVYIKVAEHDAPAGEVPEDALRFELDFPSLTMRDISPDNDTVEVTAWVLPGGMGREFWEELRRVQRFRHAQWRRRMERVR